MTYKLQSRITNTYKWIMLLYVFNSYTMGTSGLPDIYTQSPRASGLRAEGGEPPVHMV